MARTNASIKQTSEFKALVTVFGNEDEALARYKAVFGEVAEPVAAPSALDNLIAAGFTKEQAEKALADKAAPAPAAPATSKEKGEALVTEKGYTFAKGRVYGAVTLAEAIVRVFKTGTPEIVTSSGVGRTKAVLVYKEESGDVAQQNLTIAE